MSGEEQEPVHISEALRELVYDHLEPGKPVESTINSFAAQEHAEVRREQMLADEDPEVPVSDSSDDEAVAQAETLAEVERQRVEQLYRARKDTL